MHKQWRPRSDWFYVGAVFWGTSFITFLASILESKNNEQKSVESVEHFDDKCNMVLLFNQIMVLLRKQIFSFSLH